MFYLAAGWHYPSLRGSVGACPIIRPFFSCLLSWTQAWLALFGARFPSQVLQAMPCPDYHMEGKQTETSYHSRKSG